MMLWGIFVILLLAAVIIAAIFYNKNYNNLLEKHNTLLDRIKVVRSEINSSTKENDTVNVNVLNIILRLLVSNEHDDNHYNIHNMLSRLSDSNAGYNTLSGPCEFVNDWTGPDGKKYEWKQIVVVKTILRDKHGKYFALLERTGALVPTVKLRRIA